MKKIFIVLMALLLGFSSNSLAKDDCKCSEDGIQKTMEMPNESGQFSGNTFIENGKAYMRMWSGLSEVDAAFYWEDFSLLKIRGIKKVELHINSAGGKTEGGMSILNTIQSFIKDGGIVEAHASGRIASAAVPIYAVCSRRYATENTIFMVHRAKILKYGYALESQADIEAQNEYMKLVRDNYIKVLLKHSKLKKDELSGLIDKTTWFNAEQAKEWGIVDIIE